MRLQRFFDPFALVAGGHDRVFMDPAVMADLVAALEDCLNGVRVMLKTPAGNEERLLDAETLISLEDARDRYRRPIAAHCDGIKPIVRVIGFGDVDEAVGIHIEGDGAGTFGTVRPGDGILDHRLNVSR